MLQEAQERPLRGGGGAAGLHVDSPLFIISVKSYLKGNTEEGMKGGPAGGVSTLNQCE